MNNNNNCIAVIESSRDVTTYIKLQHELRKQKNNLDYQAHHDALTGLANRVLFTDRLKQSIKKSKRNNSRLALLFIDLDHFKAINDSMGHDAGDDILKKVTRRLNDLIRKKDTFARLGGDEFTIIMEELGQDQNASILAKKILEVLALPFTFNERLLYISSSIGISLCPDDGSSSQDLLKYADAAMYKAKDEGRNNFQYYNAKMTEISFERVVVESNLRKAIKDNELVVYYQPKIHAKAHAENGNIPCMEALVRWQHPTMGLVSPDQFIPLAEETGLIVKLDRFVMKTAMKQITKWYQHGINPGKLALNLSIKQLQKKYFIGFLKNLMQETQCQAEWFELEVTEN